MKIEVQEFISCPYNGYNDVLLLHRELPNDCTNRENLRAMQGQGFFSLFSFEVTS